jgi:hypothetical protein
VIAGVTRLIDGCGSVVTFEACSAELGIFVLGVDHRSAQGLYDQLCELGEVEVTYDEWQVMHRPSST